MSLLPLNSVTRFETTRHKFYKKEVNYQICLNDQASTIEYEAKVVVYMLMHGAIRIHENILSIIKGIYKYYLLGYNRGY